MAEISEAMKALLTSETIGVLATHCQGQPHASLVAFAATADGLRTPRNCCILYHPQLP